MIKILINQKWVLFLMPANRQYAANEKIATNKASVVLTSIHLRTVGELDRRKMTTTVISGFSSTRPILATTIISTSKDNAGTTSIPGTPINFTNGIEKIIPWMVLMI